MNSVHQGIRLVPVGGHAAETALARPPPEQNGEVFRFLKRLEQINDLPAGEFWKAQEK